ncbi:thioredoxin [Spiroplasma floricola]|uniref:Thioredoxin n=1 Tax=Spiroplasma floricola 23-6 TaxID=1336749 RepID=A0A2K8SD93_9MOLU|nr:thioredoxin [Spiroplasma floricola]AUB31188.1 thioredoxin [Spiroplasma floricola 23-6]
MAVKVINTVEEFDEEIAKDITVVDFYAEWCGPCKMMAPIFDLTSEEEQSVNFVKVDTDKLPEIAQRYNIMSIPTLILFRRGQVSKQNSGFMSKEILKQFIK